MDIYVTDDTIGRYFRRYQLALRMIAHGARMQTVCDWSGLTRDQLVTLRHRWGFDAEERRRGPAPTALHVFFRSRRQRSEAALLASLCRIFGVTSARCGSTPLKLLPALEHGEVLCEAFEAFREWQPDAELAFEHAVLLAVSIGRATQVALAHCSDCHAAVLFDRQGAHRTCCDQCARLVRLQLDAGVKG
jgi:hypothetical protein